MYLDIDEFTNDKPDSRLSSQFEMSTDSLRPIHNKFCQINAHSIKGLDSQPQKSVIDPKNLLNRDFGNSASSLNNFYHKFKKSPGVSINELSHNLPNEAHLVNFR